MNRKSIIIAAFVAASTIVCNCRADMVTDWNVNLEKAVRTAGVPPFFQPRFAAIVHAAIYDAVNGIVRQYTPYFVTDPAPPGARPEAAATQAAATALKGLFQAQAAAIDAELADSLATIPGNAGHSVSIQRGRDWGDYVAKTILAWRSTDGFSTQLPPFYGGTGPGEWRSLPVGTNTDGTLPAVGIQVAILTPFVMATQSQFMPGPPPALTSAQYAADVNEVEEIGRDTSLTRTPLQTQLARLWHAADLMDENRCARSVVSPDASLVQNARLFALLNMAAADALITSMHTKLTYNLWRPHHAIRLADTDNNPDTVADTNWTALILAPRFPEYISNHSIFTAAVMRVLEREFGDERMFTLSAMGYLAVTQTYNRFSDAAAEVREARIWAGIHFRTSDELGGTIGVAIADYAVDNFLRPVAGDEQ